MTARTKQFIFQLISTLTPKQAYAWQCNARKTVMPALFPQLLLNSTYAAITAKWRLKRRWPEAEPIILTDPHEIVDYAVNVIRGRWPEGEAVLMNYPVQAVTYAMHVIKNRWREAEPTIQRRADTWHYYCLRFHIEEPNVEPEVVCL